MKISQFSKITALLSTLCVVTAQAQLSLKIDRDLTVNGTSVIPVMPIEGRVQYDIASNEVRIQTEYPVICNRASDSYAPISNVKIRVTDPNGKNKGDETGGTKMLLGVQSNAYDLSSKAVEMTTESRSKGMCLSADGLDVIFKSQFAEDNNPPLVSDVSYVLNNAPLGGYAPGDNVDYHTEYQNLTGLSQLIDFIEYFPTEDSNAVYFSGLSSLGCIILDGNDTFVNSCLLNGSGSAKNVTLLPNHKIRIFASRTVSPASQVGADLIMMSAVFAKVNTIDGGSQDLQSLGGSTSHAFSGFDKQILRLTTVAPN